MAQPAQLKSLLFLSFSLLTVDAALAQGANVCANADLISSVPSSTFYSTLSPSDTPGVPATSESASTCVTQNEVWFTFVPPTTAAYRISNCGASFDTEMTLYSGDCGSLTELACNDNHCASGSQILYALSGGVTYTIAIGSAFSSSTWGSGMLDITEEIYPAATGSVASWVTAVETGTPAVYRNTDIPGPMVADIGTLSGTSGLTYEFIAHGTSDGIISACLLGSRSTGIGDEAGFKFEQWMDSSLYGLTSFGDTDYYFLGEMIREDEDLHMAFVVDTAADTTELYINGNSIGSVDYAPVLSGPQGFGLINRSDGTEELDTFYGKIRGVAIYESLLSASEVRDHSDRYFNEGIGVSYCGPGVPNTTGNSGQIRAQGSSVLTANDLTLEASDLPRFAWAYFITSQTQGFAMNPGGSTGNICLGANTGRYIGPGQVQNTGAGGAVSLPIDLNQVPQPNGFVAAMPGDTWNFQCWHRDSSAMGPTSNFTDGLSVLIR